ncbi:2TM domain-containing protein [Longivirga aurantiaca]|uniref:2TM domain-containing protein n=1 Tax=Longivirga aurantiaca TaxID=1837743 RepID=A0ABW1T048_9ACTN
MSNEMQHEPQIRGYEAPALDRPTAETRARVAARRRLEEKRKFSGHLATYVVVNAFLVGIWYWNGAGSFWPGWVMAGWGIGLVLNFWEVYLRRPITEADIEAEMRRSSGG